MIREANAQSEIIHRFLCCTCMVRDVLWEMGLCVDQNVNQLARVPQKLLCHLHTGRSIAVVLLRWTDRHAPGLGWIKCLMALSSSAGEKQVLPLMKTHCGKEFVWLHLCSLFSALCFNPGQAFESAKACVILGNHSNNLQEGWEDLKMNDILNCLSNSGLNSSLSGINIIMIDIHLWRFGIGFWDTFGTLVE